MAAKYNDYLASAVLNEGNVVNYRLLSRALKVHSNRAKEMLYDFYTIQNKRKPGSIHATYLLCGHPKPKSPSQTNGSQSKHDGDTEMHDSSFMSSSMPEENQQPSEVIPTTTITLVQEEQLQAVKDLYERIASIHIYSLEPGPLNNIQILSDCNRKVATDYANEDPLETWKQYGTIHNPTTKRRKTRQPPPPPPPAQGPATSGMKPKQAETPTTNRPTSKGSDTRTSETAQKPAAKTPALKKDNSSLFKAFSKAKAPEPKKPQVESDASAAASPAQSGPESQDEPMRDASEDEDEEGFTVINSKEAQEKAEANRKAKKEREDQLRKMMEEDDDDDVPMHEAPALATDSPEAEAELDAPAPEVKDSPPPEDEPQFTVSGGRRRGRRRVIKKKTTKDAEGYLVTKEEPVWESFSEDEPEPEAKKIKSSSSTPAAAAAKAKKPVGKPGQGNIMSFFSKK